jgi:class 3 adenylate cyclase
MSLRDELKEYVDTTFKAQWKIRDGTVIPNPDDVALNNSAVHFARVTILYADLDGSTNMVDAHKWHFAAEIYKTYLYCASRLIRSEGGEITAYDGDRVMGLFIGDYQCSSAVKCALKLNYTVRDIINPAIKTQYSTSNFSVAQCVGIDTSEVHASRTGVRGDNDLVWVGRAPNYAAKLTELASTAPTWITEDVFNRLSKEAKYGSGDNLMWEKRSWTPMNNKTIYLSTWQWKI